MAIIPSSKSRQSWSGNHRRTLEMPHFQFTLDRRTRQLGLEGKLAWASVQDGALQLQDESNHIIRIPLNEIARVRIGYVDAKPHRNYHLRVWRNALDKHLEFTPLVSSWSNYRDVMNAFANQMVVIDRLDRIETGSSKFDALLGPILMAIPAIGAMFIAAFVLTNEPWWGRLIVPLVPTILLAILIWFSVKRNWPRPLRDAKDLKPQLPPG